MLSDVAVKKVAYYTGGPAGSWLFYNPPPIPSDLTQMNDGKGYWMESAAGPLTVCGYEHCAPLPAAPPYYDVVEAWNMIGFKSTTAKQAEKYLKAIKENVMVIYGFKDGVYFRVLAGGDLEPGLGYWIALTAPGTIYP